MASRKYLQMIRKIRKWLFPFVGMEVTEEEIGLKISLEKASETPQSRAKDWKEQ